MKRKRRLELTRMEIATGLPRWRKVHEGRIFYFRGSYNDCLEQWRELRATLADTPTAKELAIWEEHQPRPVATFEEIVSEQGGLSREEKQALLRAGLPPRIQATIGKVERWRQRQQGKATFALRANRKTDTAEADTIKSAIERFTDYKKNEIGNLITASWWDALRRSLARFADFTGTTATLANLDEDMLADYWKCLDTKRKHGKSPAYTDLLLSVCKQWVRWCYRMRMIAELPRNLDDLVIKVPARKIPVFSVPEVRQLLATANDTTKLYILLALNIGATEKDISDLAPQQVDLDEGTITRKRSKTRDCENVPVVQYHLWDETARLLRIHKSGDPDRFLLTENDTTLAPCELLDDGRIRRRDAVARAFRVVRKATGIKHPFKVLRKTGASLLGSHIEYQLITHLFLGHSPRGIGERHYLRPPQQILDDGLRWLGSQFLPTTPTTTHAVCPKGKKPRRRKTKTAS